MRFITTFPHPAASERVRSRLAELDLPHETISPEPAFRLVGQPAVVVSAEVRAAITVDAGHGPVFSGWAQYRSPATAVPRQAPPRFGEDVFGRAAVMVLGSCPADAPRIRVTAHVSGDMAPALPYWNAAVAGASYNPHGPTLSLAEGRRLITVYARRVAVAKAEDIVDAWRVLEMVRVRSNQLWARRREIEPCHEMRRRPGALEIFACLPQTDCGRCGERTCLAFAVKAHGGERSLSDCRPVFGGEFAHLREALLDVGTGLQATL